MVALTRVSLKFRAVLALLTITIIGVGLFAASSIKQELFPSLEMNSAYITASYPGATPQAIETEITKPIEDAVKGVAGVTTVTSVSSSNASQVQVSWDFGRDNSKMEAALRSAVDGVTGLPAKVEPKLMVGSMDSIPVQVIAVSSNKPADDLARALRSSGVSALKQIPGVRDVQVTGDQARQVVITTRAADLTKFGIASGQIQQALGAHSAAIPAGGITDAGRTINVQVGQTLTSVADVRAVKLQGRDASVSLADVADVVEGPVDLQSLSRVNGLPATTMVVTKTQDGNVVSVSKAVDAKLPEIAKQIGDGTAFTTTFSQAPYIESSMHDLAVEGGLGLAMAIIVIMVFLLSLRSTLITAISIPLSLLIAMAALYFGRYTLNIMTLAAMTVAVGRVVDDSIVVIENIKRHMALGQPFGPGLIVDSVKEVASAVTASTITTVAVFLPLALVGGQTGELFRPFAVTISVALLASLLVALTVVPVLASWLLKPSRKQRAAAAQAPARASHESAVTGMQKAYLPALRFSLKHPLIVSAAAFLLFVGTMAMTTRLRTELLGDTGQGTINIAATLPAGTSLEQTDSVAKKIEAVLAADDGVETYDTTVGGGGYTGAAATNTANVMAKLKPHEKSAEVADRVRPLVKAIGGGDFEVQSSSGSGGSNAVTVQVQGDDRAALEQATNQIADMVKGAGVSEVKTDLAEKETTLQVKLRPDDAAKYGMDQASVGAAVLEAMRGTPLGTITIDDKSRDLLLRSSSPVKTKAELEALQLPVTAKQTADEQKRLSDALQADQKADAQANQAKSLDQLREQLGKIPDQRKQAREQLDKLLDQLSKAKEAASSTATTSPLSSAQGPAVAQPAALPADPAAAQAAQAAAAAAAAAQAKAQAETQAKAMEEAKAQAEAQVEELNKAITQARKGITAIDEQEDQLNQSIDDALAASDKAEATQARSNSIKDAMGTPVQLKAVADVVEVPVVANIRHTDGTRTVTVSAVPQGDLGTTTAGITAGLKSITLPSGVTATLGGASQEQNDAFSQLLLAMLVAIAIVYMVMVATFRSLLQPLILLVSIPFAATGAVALLLATNTPLGIPAMIGLLMLIGIVVTNAIVLIDLINRYRADGASIDDAVIHGARLRLRPIVMTALATIMALVPMAIGITGSGLFISKSLAMVVIGGLVSSTLLTLILVPALYHLVEGARERHGHRRAAREAVRAARLQEAPVTPASD